MRGAGDPRLQHPSGFARLPSSCRAACAPRKETKSRIDFFQICLVYSLLWPKPRWGGRRDVSVQRRRGGKPTCCVKTGAGEGRSLLLLWAFGLSLHLQIVYELIDCHENTPSVFAARGVSSPTPGRGSPGNPESSCPGMLPRTFSRPQICPPSQGQKRGIVLTCRQNL